MNELLKKIFDNVINQEEDAIKIFKHIDKEIDKMVDQYKEQFSDEQLMYGTALIAERLQLDIFYTIKVLIFYMKI